MLRSLQGLRVALDCLATNKLRSILTMLGVIIGVAAVIVMVSIVEGTRAQVVQQFEEMGSRLVLILFAPEERKQGEGQSHLEFLTSDDAEAIRRHCPLVTHVSPELPMDNTVFEAAGEEFKGRLVGGQPELADLNKVELAAGRFFSQDDCQGWRKVCVIGATVKKRLWPNEDPLGKSLRAQGVTFTVVGLARRKGRVLGQDPDREVYAPLTTLQKRVTGNKVVFLIFAQTAETGQVEAAADQIWALLMRRHGNQPDFIVDTQSRLLQALGKVLIIFELALGGIAGLSLLVGGIGIMNIMLVSVTERTREIGLRKAVGAKRRHILLQFLTESMTLSGIGGLIGISLGAFLSWVVNIIGKGNLNTHVPLWAALLGFSFACGVGVFFGLYPAYRAARLDPIEALRHE